MTCECECSDCARKKIRDLKKNVASLEQGIEIYNKFLIKIISKGYRFEHWPEYQEANKWIKEEWSNLKKERD